MKDIDKPVVPEPEFAGDLDAVTTETGPIGYKLGEDIREKYRKLSQDPNKREKLFNYLKGRGMKADPTGWAVGMLHWALDLGIDLDVVRNWQSRNKGNKE